MGTPAPSQQRPAGLRRQLAFPAVFAETLYT